MPLNSTPTGDGKIGRKTNKHCITVGLHQSDHQHLKCTRTYIYSWRRQATHRDTVFAVIASRQHRADEASVNQPWRGWYLMLMPTCRTPRDLRAWIRSDSEPIASQANIQNIIDCKHNLKTSNSNVIEMFHTLCELHQVVYSFHSSLCIT